MPAQAGLGGGSSDAATTLLALNRSGSLGLPRSRCRPSGVTRADVPFFCAAANAWVEGKATSLPPELEHAVGCRRARLQSSSPGGPGWKTIFRIQMLKRDCRFCYNSRFLLQHT